MDDAAPATTTIEFNNSMRGVAYTNDQFYRQGEDATNYGQIETENTPIEKHRIWLDIIAPNNTAFSTLVGYITGASNNKDRLYDGDNLSSASLQIYSMINDEKMSIQGRALPFQDTDVIPLGIKITQNGNYSVAINAVDGLFENSQQDIFLEDLYTGEVHDLRITPYSFDTDAGTFEDRFVLRYIDRSTLNVDEFENATGVVIFTADNQIKINSYNGKIEEVLVYDMLGKRLVNKKDVNQSNYNITQLRPTYSPLVVKVILHDGKQKIQKIIH